MIKVITVLNDDIDTVIEIRDWLLRVHPEIDIHVFFASKFVMQLGVYLQFFEYKNYYVLATPNSYAIDYVNYELNEIVHKEVLELMRKNNSPYLIAKYDLNVNDLLLVYEMAILDIIKLINKTPF